MRGQGSTILALALGSGLLTSLLPGISDASGPASTTRRDASAASAKGDRLTPNPKIVLRPVASLQTSGPATAPDVTMRDRDGQIVYSASQELASTRVAKGVEIVQPRHASAKSGVVQVTTARAKVPVGCERLVSSLVRSASAAQISRCVT